MPFSRSFKSQTWFVHMPSGVIEVMGGRLLERAFEARMLDGKTPVRGVDNTVWTTLAEAAGLATADGVHGEAYFDPAQIGTGAWRIGPELDLGKLESGRRRQSFLGAVGLLATLVFLLGTHLSSAFAQGSALQPRMGELLPRPTVLETNDAVLGRPASRLTFDQRQRLTTIDQWRDLEAEKEHVRRQGQKSPF